MSNVVPFRPVERESSASLEVPGDSHHMVHFYEDENVLFEAVGRFIDSGLRAGESVIVVAMPRHRDGFLRRITSLDVYRAIAEGRLVLLDARETLSRLMVGGMPQRDRFRDALGDVLAQVAKQRPGARIRAYGEMVELLWCDGLRSAAIRLEELWNEAIDAHGLSLLCAYTMTNFFKNGRLDPQFGDVCRTHTQVIAPAGVPRSEIALDPLDEMRRLRERVESLETENGRLQEFVRAFGRFSAARVDTIEERFRLLVDSVRDYAIFMLDPEGVIVTWNTGAERIKGYAANEILGKHFSVFYPAEDVAAGECARKLAVASEAGRVEEEGWRLRKDGSRFWANVVITALHDPSGRLVGFAKVTRDLTERVSVEKERLQLARMEEAGRRKDEFLAIMGHELRNPLAPLVIVARMIRLRGGRVTEKEMGVLDRQLSQMTKIVADLLDASRAMRDKVDLSLQVMEIGEVLANAVDLASPLLGERRHELEVEVPSRGLTVNVDPDRMAQVFGNVLNNAAKYTPSGGKIRLRAARIERQIEVTIEDNGQGIAPQMLERIFDLFAQADQTLERANGGLGIGLAVARRVVREHRGQIFAQSDGPGRGSRFTVRLPHVTDARPPSPPSLSEPLLVHRVLVADDSRDSVEMMQTLLAHGGHEVHVAYDGPSAMSACASFKPDTVFLDIGLPGMNGYEVAKRIRRLPGGEKIQIVAVSGYARDEDRARAMESGFSHHLTKPVEINALTEILESHAAPK
jgi:PAS domain S-box-containing protein